MAKRRKRTRNTISEQMLKILKRSTSPKVLKLKRIQKPDVFWDDVANDIFIDFDPLYQRYIGTHNFVGGITEALVQLKPCRRFQRVFDEATDIYMPGGPPMSPITDSFFQHWSLFDLELGLYKESMGKIVQDLLQTRFSNFEGAEELENLLKSRFGFYFVMKRNEEGLVFVREYHTKKEAWVNIISGYEAEVGEIIFGRLFGLAEFDYQIMTTTPYLVGGITESGDVNLLHQVEGVVSFLKRALEKHQMEYEEFLKYGPSRYYWLEYVFQAYAGHDDNSIGIVGYPDIPESMPHSRETRDSYDRFKRYHQNQGIEGIHQKTKGRKASEVLLEFLEPWLGLIQGQGVFDKKKIESMLLIGVLMWNYEVLEGREKGTAAQIFDKMPDVSEFPEGTEDLIAEMKERKREFFREYDFLVVEHFVRYEDDEFKLSVQFV